MEAILLLIRSLLSSTAITPFLLISAFAADLPGREPPVAPAPLPVFTWTGFYVGAHAGAVFADTSMTFSPFAGLDARYKRTGFAGGLSAGYNWQSGQFVTGIEGDYSFSSARKSGSVFPVLGSANLNSFGTVRVRAGLAVDRALFYVTGGAAIGQVNGTSTVFGAVKSSATRVGWTVGAGIEYALSSNWTVKAEYLYMDFGKHNVTQAPLGYVYSFKDKASVARAGVNYKF